jgi:aspartate-semialdehyde dehydrogenase
VPEKHRVAVLGATGSVGQKLVRRLADHPWFDLVSVAASSRSAGKTYAAATHWLEPQPIPRAVAGMEVRSPDDDLECELVVSALDSETAAQVEPEFASRGIPVVSNASALRMADGVPLVVPEVNPDHLDLLRGPASVRGPVVTNPNCATVGLVLALKPLDEQFGVRAVRVTTMQAVSGAGYPGVPSLDILGNLLPNIRGEEEKLEEEPLKILGEVGGGTVKPRKFDISAQTNRVPVLEGHVLSIAVRLGVEVVAEEARAVLSAWTSPIHELGLPSAPDRPLVVLDDEMRPQPRLDVATNGGMTVSVGRVRPCPALGLQMVVLVHNTERGAAGAAVLNAELMAWKGLV